MTADHDDQPAPAGFREGIYLEKKTSSIGTASTAKTAEYRNFWATGSLTAESAVMVLLDDGFKPTAIKETFSLKAMSQPNWFYIAEGEKKYQQLRPFLDRILADQQPNPKASAEEAKAQGGGNWWDGGSGPGGPPANPFELKKTKKQAPQVKKGGWWDK